MVKKQIFSFLGGIVLIVFVVGVSGIHIPHVMDHPMDERRENFIAAKESIIQDLLPQGKYRCCLEEPCTSCIEKTPGHGEGATCDCLSDVVNGVHPCGECIGQILEGHGNPYLAEYFAPAIAEKVGKQFEPVLQKIIAEKYYIPEEN